MLLEVRAITPGGWESQWLEGTARGLLRCQCFLFLDRDAGYMDTCLICKNSLRCVLNVCVLPICIFQQKVKKRKRHEKNGVDDDNFITVNSFQM